MDSLAADNIIQFKPSTTFGLEGRVANTDDGYTRLANELYEELIGANLTRNQAKVAHAICRKTYGFSKKVDRISDSQLSQLTRLPRQKVNKAKNELITMKVIVKVGMMIGPNKNLSEWEIPECHQNSDFVTKTVTKSVTKTVTGLSPKQGHTKETITKEKKETKNILPAHVQAECKTSPRKPTKPDPVQSVFETVFWCAGMRKVGKPKALSAFKSQFKAWRKETGGTPEQFAEFLVQDIRSRLQAKIFGFENMHPATYLNQQRWTDEKPITNTPTNPMTAQAGITVSQSGLVFLE